VEIIAVTLNDLNSPHLRQKVNEPWGEQVNEVHLHYLDLTLHQNL
jgi:hypothetical protein